MFGPTFWGWRTTKSGCGYGSTIFQGGILGLLLCWVTVPKSQSLFTKIYFSGVELYSELTLGICFASRGILCLLDYKQNHSVSSDVTNVSIFWKPAQIAAVVIWATWCKWGGPWKGTYTIDKEPLHCVLAVNVLLKLPWPARPWGGLASFSSRLHCKPGLFLCQDTSLCS